MKKPKEEKPRLHNRVIAVLIAAAIIILGVYALGGFDSGSPLTVDQMEYVEGGFTYSGSLKDGHFDDWGVILFDNGDIYEGGFLEGRYNGEAGFSRPDAGDEEIWLFDGVFEGGYVISGTFHMRDGTLVSYDSSPGTETITGSAWQYIGGFNERGQNGVGSFTFYDGAVYTGDFMNGTAFGEGMFIDASGATLYTGEFLNGCFDGQGTYFSPDGWIYRGGFTNGTFDGEGLLFIDGAVIRGVWEAGVQVIRYE